MLKLKILNKLPILKLKCTSKFPDVVLANLQEKEVTPSKQIQEVIADKPYDGLSKVIVNEYTPVVDNKTITKNGVYNAVDDNLDGYSSVSVETSGVDINDYFNKQVSNGYSSYSGINRVIKRVPNDIVIGNNASYLFYYCSSLIEVPQIDTSNVTNMSYMFAYCSSLKTVPLFNTGKVTDTSLMFERCSALESVPLFDLSNVTNMLAMFRYCSKLKSIPLFNTSKVTNMSNTFLSSGLIEFPQIDTSNVTDVSQMLSSCYSLTTVPLLDFGKVNQGTSNIFDYSRSLVNLGGLKDLGKAYLTTESANNYKYRLNLRNAGDLTHTSLMNVINNLYDIASAGVQPQQLVIGASNIAKLSSDELNVATVKGFTVS